MTLFSYVTSTIKKENFKEPELLGMLLYDILPHLKKQHRDIIGWNLHYLVGLTFAFLYAKIWEDSGIKPTLKSGLILGALSGILGISVWKLCFRIHPHPPKISFRRYYGHLLVTHLIFGVFTVLGYSLRRKHRTH